MKINVSFGGGSVEGKSLNSMPYNSFAVLVGVKESSHWEIGDIVYRPLYSYDGHRRVINLNKSTYSDVVSNDHRIRPLRADETIVIREGQVELKSEIKRISKLREMPLGSYAVVEVPAKSGWSAGDLVYRPAVHSPEKVFDLNTNGFNNPDSELGQDFRARVLQPGDSFTLAV